MKKIKFLHCADIHMDAPFTSLGANSGKAPERRQDLKHIFGEITGCASEYRADVLLISGDLFEHRYVKKSTINFINDKFTEISGIKVFIVPGNHDPNVGNSYYRNFSWANNVCILDEKQEYVILEDLGVCIYGIGFKDFFKEAAEIKNIKIIHPELINILLVHGTVDMDMGKAGNLYNPVDSSELAALNMDYIALGHFHNRIDDMGGHGMIYNPGSPEPLGFDEEGDHGIYIGEITKNEDSPGSSLKVDFKKLNRKFYVNMDVNVSGCITDEQVIAAIDRAIENKNIEEPRDGLFNISLKGYVESGFKVNSLQVLAHFRDRMFFIKIKDQTDLELDIDSIRREPGLRGLFARKIMDIMETADDMHQKDLLMKALYYGIEALENGKVEIN